MVRRGDFPGAASPTTSPARKDRERIGAEWWHNHKPHCEVAPTRDYYLVEDSGGRRFWLYREGLYGREAAAARWFVHGLFA